MGVLGRCQVLKPAIEKHSKWDGTCAFVSDYGKKRVCVQSADDMWALCSLSLRGGSL